MKISRIRSMAWLAALLWVAPAAAQEDAWNFSADLGVESRYFPRAARWPGQSGDVQFSQFFDLEARWRTGSQRITIKPYGRFDSVDVERNHFDLREAWWTYDGEDWGLLVGANKVFWGVAESRHLVDIINQTDLVDDPGGKSKLGQPMAQLTLQRDWGALDVFVMPYFRERTFPGYRGRLRAPLVVDTAHPQYESSAGAHHTDVALRWSQYFGDVDIGFSAFHGTGRNPTLAPADEGDLLVPYYHQITQWGIDLQYTRDAWLWKGEAILRNGYRDTFFASVAGLEYTFFGVGESDRDVGLLVEYLYDGRGPSEPVTAFDNDLFFGTRLAFNDAQDTSLLAGAVVDADNRDWFLSIKADRRLGDHYTIEARLRLFNGQEAGSSLFALDRDDHFQVSLTRYF